MCWIQFNYFNLISHLLKAKIMLESMAKKSSCVNQKWAKVPLSTMRTMTKDVKQSMASLVSLIDN